MDKIECPLFHEFDNACCGDRECGFQREVLVVPYDRDAPRDAIVAYQSTLAFALLATIVAFGLLFGAYKWDESLRTNARIYQEASIRY